MSIPQRFKETSTPAGLWMTAGSEEKPPTLALNRAAERLGIPLSVLATAVTAANVANASGLAASASANVPTTVAASVGNARAVGIASLAKGTIVGLGVGLALFAAIELLRPTTPIPSPTKGTAPSPSPTFTQGDVRESAPTTASPLDARPRTSQTTQAPSEPPITATSKDSLARLLPPRDVSRRDPAHSGNGSGVAPLTRTRAEAYVPTPPDRTQELDVPSESPTNLADREHKTTVASEAATPTDIRLAREVKSVDRTRSLLKTGDAVAALEELDSFDRQVGYSILQREATLVRIDVLMALERNTDATTLARRLLATCTPSERARLETQLEKKGLSL